MRNSIDRKQANTFQRTANMGKVETDRQVMPPRKYKINDFVIVIMTATVL
jgi:hypothetical protein